MLSSLITNKVLFRFDKIFILGFLFCSLLAFDALGQEERAVHQGDSPEHFEEINDRSSTDYHHVGQEGTDNKTVVPKKDIQRDHLQKQRGEKEGRKEGMSTLSFNLFLYVVDRFKENN